MATDVGYDAEIKPKVVAGGNSLRFEKAKDFGDRIQKLREELFSSPLDDVVDLQRAVETFLSSNSRQLDLTQKQILAQIRNYAEVVSRFQSARTLGDKKRRQEAIESGIDFQQRLALVILENSVVGADGLAFTNRVDEVFKLLFDIAKKVGDEDLLESEQGYIDGCRAMVSACLTLRMCGWEVSMPKASWDRYFDIDLISVSPAGRRYGIDVTTGREGKIYLGDRSRKRPRGATFDGIIIFQVPKLSDDKNGEYFERKPRLRTLGVPSSEVLEKIRASLEGVK